MSINETIKKITALGVAHEQIKTVLFGNIFDMLDGERNYPIMFFDLDNASIGERNSKFTYSFYFFDRVITGQTNETEVISDMMGVCEDIVAQLRQQDYEWTVPSVGVEIFTDETPDLLAGVKASVTLEYPFINDRCQIPSSYQF